MVKLIVKRTRRKITKYVSNLGDPVARIATDRGGWKEDLSNIF